MSEKRRKYGVVSPILHGRLKLKNHVTICVIARYAPNGSEKDLVLGVEFFNGGGSVKVWLDGRIHATEICMNLEEIQEVFSSCPNHKNKSGPIRISEKLDRNKPEDRWAHCIERATVKHLSKAGIVTMREFTKDLDGSEIDISIQYRNHIFSDKFDKAGLTEFFK